MPSQGPLSQNSPVNTKFSYKVLILLYLSRIRYFLFEIAKYHPQKKRFVNFVVTNKLTEQQKGVI